MTLVTASTSAGRPKRGFMARAATRQIRASGARRERQGNPQLETGGARGQPYGKASGPNAITEVSVGAETVKEETC